MSQPAGLADVAEQFMAIAESIEARQPDEVLLKLFQEAQLICRLAAGHERLAEPQRLLTNVQTALATWQDVWPRLGSRPEFRLAVVREARLWSKRFAETGASGQ